MMSWKWTHDKFNFYWNDECSETVKKTKKLRQIFINSQNEKNWKIYFHANNYKQKIIHKTKILKFWKTINTNVANKKKLWRLIRWIKIKNYVSNELLKIFTLIKNMQKDVDTKLTTFFENKTWFLIDEFFSTLLSTDLNDIFGAAYLILMHCSTIIIKKKWSKSWKNWIQIKHLNWMILSINFWKFVKMIWSTCWHYFFKHALIKNIISKHIKKTT